LKIGKHAFNTLPVKIVGGGHPLGWDATQHLHPKLTCNHCTEYLFPQ